ncbi:MAG: hypothetical protein PHS44_04075 [Candidatus Dojkabacteria bacterium]|nr:hypothetical protein [Candidatus Dojkabacteria bacterium]
MLVQKVVKELSKLYPGKTIIENKNIKGITTEIICEIDPASDHSEYSIALAVIDYSTIHCHNIITETYKVIKGNLTIFKGDREYKLGKGDEIVVKPKEIHSNLGKETWVEVVSKPGWYIEDYINLETILKKYLPKR